MIKPWISWISRIAIVIVAVAALSRPTPASSPSLINRRRQGLRRLPPNLIDKARDDTAAHVMRILLTFVGTAAFCLISLSSPDSALLAGKSPLVPHARPRCPHVVRRVLEKGLRFPCLLENGPTHTRLRPSPWRRRRGQQRRRPKRCHGMRVRPPRPVLNSMLKECRHLHPAPLHVAIHYFQCDAALFEASARCWALATSGNRCARRWTHGPFAIHQQLSGRHGDAAAAEL